MSSTANNRLESLSNELLLDIFEYLDAYNLYQAFHGLNDRLNTLLQTANLHILLQSPTGNQTVWDSLALFFKPSQIRMLTSCVDNVHMNKRLLSWAKPNLHSLRLSNISEKSINEMLPCSSDNNQIKFLYITIPWSYYSKDQDIVIDFVLVKHAHRFTSLVNLSLPFYPNAEFPMISVVFPQLRRLSFNNCHWTLNLGRFLQDCTPNLRSLKFLGSIQYSSEPLKFNLKHIHELHLTYPRTQIDLAPLLSSFPCLRRLRIDWINSQRSMIIDGSHWQKLIETYIPGLKQFTLDCSDGATRDIVESFYVGDFWSTKKVNAIMLINKTEFRCPLVKTIYFGPKWQFGYF